MIKGKVVGLRSIEKEDLSILRDWRNTDSFRKNFREFRELSMRNQELWHEKMISSSTDFMFIIERIDDKIPLGACGLLYANWIIRSADYSFYIGYQDAYIDDEGYAEEASRLLINYGFNNLNLNKIWMELYEFDNRKLTFFEKLGFKVDGRLRDNCYEDGRYHDSFLISILKREWETKL